MSGNRLAWALGAVVLLGGGFAMISQFGASGNAQQTPPRRTQFAEEQGAGEGTSTRPVAFDAARAMRYLKQICAIGPRISATEGMRKQIELLQKHFTDMGAQVELQRFTAQQRSQRRPVEMVNLIAKWHPERPRRVIICTHYDTRPIADREPDRRDWSKPFVGANDSGSGAALLMEMAHHMKELPLQVGVDFVLFDGEEYIFDNTPSEQGGDMYFFGSRHFADRYAQARQRDGRHPVYVEAVLLDMIAGKQPLFRYEGHSYMYAGTLVDKIWRIAGEVGATAFVRELGQRVLDDHLQLLNAGIPAIDIVPAASEYRPDEFFLTYPHWHRLSDVPENCAPEGLEQVARVLSVWMQRAR